MSRVLPILAALAAAAAATSAAAQITPLGPAPTPSTPPDPTLPAAAPVVTQRSAPAPAPAPALPPPPSAAPVPAAPPPGPPVATRSVVPQPVEVQALAAPDAFSTPARPTGLPATLWKGASLDVVRAVLPKLAERPLSPAAAALARRVLATGAPGPAGAGQDPALIAARAAALMGQGDPKAAAALLARAPGLDRDPALARVAAESALLAGRDDRACQIEEGLGSGRDDIYWLRLRTYCQAIAGKSTEAQLTFDLAQSQAKDATFGRLMAAKLSGGGSPGAPSLRNGLDYALSRSLGLDLSKAKPAPEVAAALSAADPGEPALDISSLPPELAPFGQAIVSGQPVQYEAFSAAVGAPPKGKAGARFDDAMVLLAAFEGWPPSDALPATREARAPVLRDLALDAAAARRQTGEAAMLALWNCVEAEPAGLPVADRARIVWALRQAGLDADARAFALEGLAGLK